MFSINCGSVSAVNVLKCTILKIFIWRTDRWQCFLINMMKNQLHLASYLSNLASYLQEYYWWETWLVRFWLVDYSANTWKNLPCFLRKVPRHGRHVRKVPVRWKKSHMCPTVCAPWQQKYHFLKKVPAVRESLPRTKIWCICWLVTDLFQDNGRIFVRPSGLRRN